MAHDDRAALEVQILDAQLQRLGDPHAGTVEQLRQHPVLALQQRQQTRHLGHRQHRRQPGRALRPADRIHPRQVQPQHLLVQEQQRRQRLSVGGHRDIALGRQPGQKVLNLGLPHLARMAKPLVPDEGPHPVDISLLGP